MVVFEYAKGKSIRMVKMSRCQLDYVIEMIERLNIDGNATSPQSIEQPGPSHKFPNRMIKIV
jgi:hypothetical protein